MPRSSKSTKEVDFGSVDFARDIGESLLLAVQCGIKKKERLSPGHLFVTSTRIAWCPVGSVIPAVAVPFGDIANHQYSPANNAKVMLKLTAKQGNSFVFEFTSPSTKDADRSNVREIVSQVTPQKKEAPKSSKQAPVVKTEPVAATAASLVQVKPEPVERAARIEPDGIEQQLNANGITVQEARHRAHLLANDTQVKLLHNDLVSSGIVSEEEFWQARHADLQSAALRPRAQQRGTPTALLHDLEPAAMSADRQHYRLSPAQIRAIFVEQPSVAKVYRDLVPDKLSENQFWTKYLHSRHFHRERQKSKQRRVRTKSTPEDDALLRAIEAAETVDLVADPDAPRRAVSLAQDIGADDSELDAHYGQRADANNRPLADAHSTALIAGVNRHSALVLDAETHVPSIAAMIRTPAEPLAALRKDVTAAAAATADEPAPSERDELTPHAEECAQALPLDLNRNRYGARPVAAQDGALRAAVARLLDTGWRPDAPSSDAALALMARADRRAEEQAAAVREQTQPGRPAGGATTAAVHELADRANQSVLSDLHVPDAAAATFRDDVYTRFARANELLRHFWNSYPLSSSAAVAKVARLAVAITALHDDTERAKNALPAELRGALAPVLLELMTRLTCALERHDRTLRRLAEQQR